MEEKKNSNHIEVYLVWPLLSGLGLSIVLAISVGGIAGMAGKSFAAAFTWAGYTFFGVLGLATVGVFLYAANDWAGPRFIEWNKRTVDYIEGETIEVPGDTRFIPTRSNYRTPAPVIPANAPPPQDSAIMAALKELVAPRPSTVIEGVALAETEAIGPGAVDWVEEFYTVINAMWGKSLSRNSFRDAFENRGQALYYKYVGKVPPCSAKEKGIWQTWGIIDRVANKWQFCETLDVIYAMDPLLAAYANSKSKLISPPPVSG